MKSVAIGILVILTGSKVAFCADAQRDSDELSYRGRTLSSLLADLKNPDAKVRTNALHSISWLGDDARKVAIPALKELLHDSEVSVREELMSTLRIVGGRHPDAVAAFREALNDRAPIIRIRAANILADNGIDKKENVARLLDALKDQNSKERHWAVWHLARLDLEASQVIPALVEGLRDQDRWVRKDCAKVLGTLGAEGKDAVPALRSALDDIDEHVRMAAALALWRTSGESSRSISVLVELLGFNTNNDVSWDEIWGNVATADANKLRYIAATHVSSALVRDEAARALGEMGPSAYSAVPALLPHLLDRESRSTIARVLSDISPATIPQLIQRLDAEDRQVRASAAEALGAYGIVARTAVPRLQKCLNDPDPFPRTCAVEALRKIKEEPRKVDVSSEIRPTSEAIPTLIQALKSGSSGRPPSALGESIRLRSFESIIGQKGDPRLRSFESITGQDADPPPLPILRNDPSDGASWRAAWSLGRIGPKAREAIPALLAALRSPVGRVRVAAAEALWRIDGRTQPLLDALGEDLESVRRYAAIDLGKLGSEARIAVPALVKALDDEDESVREAAAEALGLIGIQDKAAPSLRRAMNDKKVGMRVKSAEALWKLEKSQDAIDVLAKMLTLAPIPDGADHRLDAADALRDIGPEAHAAGPALRECIAKAPAYPRKQALYALEKVNPKMADEVWNKLYDPPQEAPIVAPAEIVEERKPVSNPKLSPISVVFLIVFALGALIVCVRLVIKKSPTVPTSQP